MNLATACRRLAPTLTALSLAIPSPVASAVPPELWSRENLFAWCIVPFDAKKRDSEQRAQMLDLLGLRALAYDFRAEHVPTFDTEVETMKRHGIKVLAWWFPTTLNDDARHILAVCKRHKIAPQLWVMGGGEPVKTPAEQEARVEREAARLLPIARAAAEIGSKVALYNHGAWFGEPENQLAIIARLARDGVKNVGIVFNFHHAHDYLPRFPELWRKMMPHLLAVNLNGMEAEGDKRGRKILHLSEGDRELAMMQFIAASGWRGPVGIIDHRPETDSAETLRNNLRGFDWLVAELRRPGSGGPRPTFDTTLSAPPKKSAPAAPALDRAPLDPTRYPLHTLPENQHRIYDFYAKQARDYAAAAVKPVLLPEYPGLDGGLGGHWGTKGEGDWANDGWSHMDCGSTLAGVLNVGGKKIARAICVRLADGGACFDPETLSWPAAWSGGFVKFGTARWGLLDGLKPDGPPRPAPAGPTGGEYLGYYRHGARVIFSYRRDGAEWLETIEGRERKGEGALTKLTQGGPAQWPQTFITKGIRGEGAPYAIDTLPPPAETPWRSLWHFGDHDFLPNGDLAVCTIEGEVWTVSGVDDSLARLVWRRIASGLHQPLGLRVVEGKVCVLGRDRITRLHDLNGDGEADFYESICDAYLTPTGGHDYVTGLQRDPEGRFYFASGKQVLVRTSADLKSVEVLATGFRNPNGIGLGPRGEVTIGVQEGDWTPASLVHEILPQPGEPGHYGHGGPRPGPRGHLPPLVYLPRGEDNSCGGQCFVEGDRWGVPAGTLVHFSWGTGRAFLVLRERLGDVAQGCAIPLPGDFRSGAHRGRFDPRDGQLYVTGMTGWTTFTPDEGCLQRMRFTGGAARAPLATEARENGVLLRFAEPLAAGAGKFFAQQWNYRYSASYGSAEYSVRQPELRGHDALAIASAHRFESGRALFLEIPQLQPANVLHLHCDLPGLVARDFFLTLHRLGPAFTDFPGYRAIAKTAHEHHPPTSQVAARPVKWEQGQPGRALHLRTAAGMQFEQKELRAKAGERVSLTLENPDPMPHNWVLVQPGSLERVGALANALVADPAGLARHYVPDSPDVLCHTRVLDPQRSTTIHFNAPTTPGRYPYVCTFPGHWMLMRGELIVEQ